MLVLKMSACILEEASKPNSVVRCWLIKSGRGCSSIFSLNCTFTDQLHYNSKDEIKES